MASQTNVRCATEKRAEKKIQVVEEGSLSSRAPESSEEIAPEIKSAGARGAEVTIERIVQPT
jgi:hypothetical protein